jgi:hypothetical protein
LKYLGLNGIPAKVRRVGLTLAALSQRTSCNNYRIFTTFCVGREQLLHLLRGFVRGNRHTLGSFYNGVAPGVDAAGMTESRVFLTTIAASLHVAYESIYVDSNYADSFLLLADLVKVVTSRHTDWEPKASDADNNEKKRDMK